MKRLITLMLMCVFLVCVPISAHPGRTDGAGGHYDRSSGEYHYHHGYSAHQHPNGECPYDYEDKTSSSSERNRITSEERSSWEYSDLFVEEETTTSKDSPKTSILDSEWFWFIALFGGSVLLLFSPVIYYSILELIEKIKDKFRK